MLSSHEIGKMKRSGMVEKVLEQRVSRIRPALGF